MINKERSNKINIFLSEVSIIYHRFIMETYAEVVILLVHNPLQPILEAENFFTHLMQAIDSEDENSFDKNLEEAKRHVEKMALDIIKILWIELHESIVLLLEKDKISSEDYLTFKKLATEARTADVRDLDSERIEVLNLYKRAIDFGKEKIKNTYKINNSLED